MKSKTHAVLVHVRFNRKCTAEWARQSFANCVHGLFYPPGLYGSADDPDEMRITSVRRAPARRAKR